MANERPGGAEVEFDPETQPETEQSDGLARRELEQFGRAAKENTVMIRLWRGGYISFNPEDSVPIFAFLALILLLGVVIITVIAGIWISETGWMDRLTTALGHAITAVIGAIVGSSAAKATSK